MTQRPPPSPNNREIVRLVRTSNIPRACKALYLVLLALQEKAGPQAYTVAWLGDELGVHARTITRQLGILEKHGVLARLFDGRTACIFYVGSDAAEWLAERSSRWDATCGRSNRALVFGNLRRSEVLQ